MNKLIFSCIFLLSTPLFGGKTSVQMANGDTITRESDSAGNIEYRRFSPQNALLDRAAFIPSYGYQARLAANPDLKGTTDKEAYHSLEQKFNNPKG